MTEIEELWAAGRVDDETIRVNGSLMHQATFICPKCGVEKEGERLKCTNCQDTGDCDA